MKKHGRTTHNIKNGRKVVNMNGLVVNKRCSKLKVWSIKCPTFHIAVVRLH